MRPSCRRRRPPPRPEAPDADRLVLVPGRDDHGLRRARRVRPRRGRAAPRARAHRGGARAGRGGPLGPDGYFSLPLFHILNWYALLVGVFGLVVLAAHGAAFLAVRATGDLADRARRLARRLWWAEVLLFLAMVGPTYAVRDEMLTSL